MALRTSDSSTSFSFCVCSSFRLCLTSANALPNLTVYTEQQFWLTRAQTQVKQYATVRAGCITHLGIQDVVVALSQLLQISLRDIQCSPYHRFIMDAICSLRQARQRHSKLCLWKSYDCAHVSRGSLTVGLQQHGCPHLVSAQQHALLQNTPERT